MLYTIMIGTSMYLSVPSLEACELVRQHVLTTAIVEISNKTEFCIDGIALVTCVKTRDA